MSKHIEFDALTQKYRYLSETHRWSRLIPAQPNGSHIPLFMVAGYVGADDTLLLVSNLIPHLGPDQPVYGFQPRWLDGHSEPYSSVDEVVREFLAELRVAQPKGPYQLGGHCVGGVIALEMARELIRQGEEVRLLVMVDTDRPSTLRGLMMESAALGRRARHIMRVIRTILGSDHRTRMRLIRDLGRRKLQTARPNPAEELPFDRAYRLAAGYRKLIYRHRPKKYPGRITLVVNEGAGTGSTKRWDGAAWLRAVWKPTARPATIGRTSTSTAKGWRKGFAHAWSRRRPRTPGAWLVRGTSRHEMAPQFSPCRYSSASGLLSLVAPS